MLKIGQPADEVVFFLAQRPPDAGNFISRGYRGAFESHLAVLTEARNQGLPNTLVLEDDIAFPRDFENRSADLTRLPDDWNLLYLGHEQPKSAMSKPAVEGWRKLPPGEEVIGLHCYAVDERFLRLIADEMPKFALRPRDHPEGGPMSPDGVLNVIRRLNPQLRCFAVEPALAYQRPSVSDVGGERNGVSGPLSFALRLLRVAKGRLLYK